MKSNFFLFLLKVLKLPLKLLVGLLGNKPKTKKTELEKKQLAYVRNFDPTRLKNISWPKSSGKDKKTSKKKKLFLKNKTKEKTLKK